MAKHPKSHSYKGTHPNKIHEKRMERQAKYKKARTQKRYGNLNPKYGEL